MEKSYRVRTSVNRDKVLQVNLTQDVDVFEVLSLKISQKDLYRSKSSNYGVVVGRVLANGGFGVPNAKVSVFVELSDADKLDQEIRALYPYTMPVSVDRNNVRYNLLADISKDSCHQAVGTFPNKRLVLDNDDVLEVYDKYWRYTTTTNYAGDYMIYGVPVGDNMLHLDVDMSDIGILSQSPRDFIYKGYDRGQFENASQFKTGDNLDSLPQIFSQNQNIYVYPFWGDTRSDTIAITRADINVDYTFEPTCVFLGAVVTDNSENSIGDKCTPSEKGGTNRELVAGMGTIEMIRKTPGGNVEEFEIQGNQLIDEDGVWCYQIPMNLDYVITDEYGNIAPTDNPKYGIPTRASVRFRFTFNDTGDEAISRHRARYLVPNNPDVMDDSSYPYISDPAKLDEYYEFGAKTPENCFRDLYWNKVYSVKNYIPRLQMNNKVNTDRYSALRLANYSEGMNPVPFNRLRVKIPFKYRVLCALAQIVIFAVSKINWLASKLDRIPGVKWETCIRLSEAFFLTGEEDESKTLYMPGCDCYRSIGKRTAKDYPGYVRNCDAGDALDKIQQRLAEEFEIANLDFYNDWLNGTLYMPLWWWKRKKHYRYLFGLFGHHSVDRFCSCNNRYGKLRVMWPCTLPTSSRNNMAYNGSISDEDYHVGKKYVSTVPAWNGIVKESHNEEGLPIYYYSPGNTNSNSGSKAKFTRLYSTDIILLGSLNSCDADGTPQAYKYLPPTTANIPPIATAYETPDIEEPVDGESDVDSTQILWKQIGTQVITGLDWTSKHSHKDDENGIEYGKGVVFDLACSKAKTQPKTCVNVERMCELNMARDESYPYNGPNGEIQVMRTDALISRYEIEENDPRAMFATINHNGFVPVLENGDINDSVKEFDRNTGYYRQKYHFLYPQNFDGKLRVLAPSFYTRYATDGILTQDYQDEDYLTFRFGGSNKHFYGTNQRFPLYNNSFYFYFGLHPGSTAIDKFRTNFEAECVEKNEDVFAMSVEIDGVGVCHSKEAPGNGFGLIKVNLKNAITPYVYKLYHDGILVVSESGMGAKELIFGMKVAEGGMAYTDEPYGKFQYYRSGRDVVPEHYLTSGVYTITVVDGSGVEQSQSFVVEQKVVTMSYITSSLGTKWNGLDSDKNRICENGKGLSGSLTINGFMLGDEAAMIQSFVPGTPPAGYETEAFAGAETYIASLSNGDTVLLEIQPTEAYGGVLSDYMCGGHFFDLATGTVEFRFWKPVSVAVRVSAICNGVVINDENLNEEGKHSSTISYVSIQNGTDFYGLFNNFPMNYMANKVSIPDDFYQLNSSYLTTISITDANATEWESYLNRKISEVTDDVKLDAVRFLFNGVFGVARGQLVSEGEDNSLSLDSVGGRRPILRRGGYTDYTMLENDIDSHMYWVQGDQIRDFDYYEHNNYTCDSGAYVKNDGFGGNIVGSNFFANMNSMQWPPISANTSQENPAIQKNYFAVFTNNGGLKKSGTSCVHTSNEYQACPDSPGITPELVPGMCFASVSGLEGPPATTNGYLTANFIDRRFDYCGVFVGATPWGGSISGISFTGATKNARMHMEAFNGIPMATDEAGRIMDGPSSDNHEYYYTVNGDTISLKWNENAVRRYKSTTLSCDGNVLDLTKAFFQEDTSERTLDGADISTIAAYGSATYHTFSGNWFVHGERNKYPIRRMLAIDNIPSASAYIFKNESYSYDIEASLSEDGTSVYADGKGGEVVSIGFDMGNPIVLGKYQNNGLTAFPVDLTFKATLNGNAYICAFAYIGDDASNSGTTKNIPFTVKPDSVNTESMILTKKPFFMNLKNNQSHRVSKILSRKNPSTPRCGGIERVNMSNMLNIVVSSEFDAFSDVEKTIYSQDGESFYGSSNSDRYDSERGSKIAVGEYSVDKTAGYFIETLSNVSTMPLVNIHVVTKNDLFSADDLIFVTGDEIEFTRGNVLCCQVVRDYLPAENNMITRRFQTWNYSAMYDLQDFTIGALSCSNGDLTFTVSGNFAFSDQTKVEVEIGGKRYKTLPVGSFRHMFDVDGYNAIIGGTGKHQAGIYINNTGVIYYVKVAIMFGASPTFTTID